MSDLLRRFEAGESAADLAAECGVCKQTLYERLRRDRGGYALPRGGRENALKRRRTAPQPPFRVAARYPGSPLTWLDETYLDRRYAERAVRDALAEAALTGYGVEVELHCAAGLLRTERLLEDERGMEARRQWKARVAA